ncbi:hypothetical protein KFU94_43740 [Chloroflexi bacterium TSY]|nr:hypothetical protein [Chloroflexi bacterium TSY]
MDELLTAFCHISHLISFLLPESKDQYDFEIRKLSSEQAAENIESGVREELGRQSNTIGRFTEIVVAAVMKGFTRETVDGPAYFSTPNPVTVPKFDHIEHRWGVIADDGTQELDLIGEYQLWDGEREEWATGAWFVQVKYRKEKANKSHVERFLQQIDAVQSIKEYAEQSHWFVSKGGFTEPAKMSLAKLGFYSTDLVQFNALAREFGYLGFPEKVDGY